jgi:phage protein D
MSTLTLADGSTIQIDANVPGVTTPSAPAAAQTITVGEVVLVADPKVVAAAKAAKAARAAKASATKPTNTPGRVFVLPEVEIIGNPTPDPDLVVLNRDAPVYYVKIYKEGAKEGERIDVTERVLSFSYDDDEAKADKLTITLDNYDLSLFDDPLWKKGNFIESSWGYAGATCPAHECVIQSIKGFQVLTVEALSKSILMNKLQRADVYENKTHAQIAAEVAQRNGFSLNDLDIEDDGVVQAHVSQAKMTDAQFLKHLANRVGYQFFIDWQGFHFGPRKLGKAPVREFVFFTDPGRGDILAINVENDVTATPGVVTAKGRDPLKKADINEKAKDGSTAKIASGIEVFEQVDAPTSTVHATTRPTKPAGGATILGAKSATDGAAQAKGKLAAATLAAVQITMTIVGDPRIEAKQIIRITGISKRLSGNYYTRSVKHSFGNGYTTEIKCATDGPQFHPDTKPTAAKTTNDQKPKAGGDTITLAPIELVDEQTSTTRLGWKRGDPPAAKAK